MSRRGPKSERDGRQKIAEDDKTATYLADSRRAEPVARAMMGAMADTAAEFGISPEEQLLAAGMALAMLTKAHGAVETDVLRMVSKCIRGTHLVGAAKGSS